MYDEMLSGVDGITTPVIEPGNWSIYNQYVVRVKDRDRVKKVLGEKGVGCAVYYPAPLHLQPCFAYLGVKEGALPESERACKEVLALPIYPELPEEQLALVAQELRSAVRA